MEGQEQNQRASKETVSVLSGTVACVRICAVEMVRNKS